MGLGEFDLVSHDMGDTVAGELLARHVAGELTVDGSPPTIGRRVVTNGSIYLEMARLTEGQKALWRFTQDATGVERSLILPIAFGLPFGDNLTERYMEEILSRGREAYDAGRSAAAEKQAEIEKRLGDRL